MRHSSLLALLALLGSACAFGPGGPYGELSASLDARYQVPQDRALEGGYARLASDYRLRVDVAEVELGRVSLRSAPEGAVKFDPSRPPPGYGACHGGHCHREADGALIPYEEIARELGGGAEPREVLGFEVGSRVDLLQGRTLPFGCAGACDLGRIELASAQVGVLELRVEGAVQDVRGRVTGELPFRLWARPGEDGAPGASWTHALELPFDRAHPPKVTLALQLHPGPRHFDDLAWDALEQVSGTVDLAAPANRGARDELLARLAEQALQAHITREE
jgi:hypothetical protein